MIRFQGINYVKILGKRKGNVLPDDNRMLQISIQRDFFFNLSLQVYISQLKVSSGPLDFYVHNIRDNILIK